MEPPRMKKLKCCGCKDRFPADTMIELPAGNFHSFGCAIDYSKAKSDKARAKAKKQRVMKEKKSDNKRKKEFKLNDLPYQHKLTQKVFNRMRVLQELVWFKSKGLPPRCISCHGKLGGDQWCCGHFKTTHNSLLRYDELNTFLQHNHRCNMNLSGDIEGAHNTMGYKKGLITRFGKEEGQEIIDYCDNSNAVKKWTGEELAELRKRCNIKIKRLLKEIDA